MLTKLFQRGRRRAPPAAAGRLGAPDGVDAALAFLLALEARDWEDLPVWAELLAREVVEGRRWIRPGVVLDSGIAAYLAGGKVEAAESLFRRLEPRSGRSPSDLRSQLLAAHLDRALSSR